MFLQNAGKHGKTVHPCVLLSVSIPFPQAMLRALILSHLDCWIPGHFQLRGSQHKTNMAGGQRAGGQEAEPGDTPPHCHTHTRTHAHIYTYTYTHHGEAFLVTDSEQFNPGSNQDLPPKLRGVIKFQTDQEFSLGFQATSLVLTHSFYYSSYCYIGEIWEFQWMRLHSKQLMEELQTAQPKQPQPWAFSVPGAWVSTIPRQQGGWWLTPLIN